MKNYTNENLLKQSARRVPAGTPAIKVDDTIFLAGNVSISGLDISDTTAVAEDVKKGKVFYLADGSKATGTNTDVNVSGTTAVAEDVLEGRQFYNAAGVLTQGTLVPQTGGGSSAEMFLCNYVNRNYFSIGTLIVSGFPTDVFADCRCYDGDWNLVNLPAEMAARNPNGTYVLTNPAETDYYSRLWKAENGCCIKGTYLFPDESYASNGIYPSICREEIYENDTGLPAKEDYTSYAWMKDWSTISGVSVVFQEPPPIDEKYWMGYKLFQDESGKWDYESELTKLTYSNYMPVVGRIYDAGATMEIGNVDFSGRALYACPFGLTAVDGTPDKATVAEGVDMFGGRWIVSTNSGVYSGSIVGPFDNNFNTDFNEKNSDPYTPTYLQWQNLEKPTVVKKIEMYTGYPQDYSTNFKLFGSNDGENWDFIFNEGPEFSYVNEGGARYRHRWEVKNDCAPYYYYRFESTAANMTFCVYELRAYCQKEREVPK